MSDSDPAPNKDAPASAALGFDVSVSKTMTLVAALSNRAHPGRQQVAVLVPNRIVEKWNGGRR